MMNRLEAMQIFVRVAELASFTQAADSMGLPKASISSAVKQLESLLGTRLLHRTTRKVQLTQDGQTVYERSKDLLADMDELQSMFQQGEAAISGRLRVDMSSGVARNIVIPQLPAFLEVHPRLELELSSTDRRVDIVREGFDCVLRVGMLTDSTLIARPLGRFHMVNCASPAYLRRYGTPNSLGDLAHHRLIQYTPSLGAKPAGWEYFDGVRYSNLSMAGVITVNNADAYQAACLAGLGLIQVPQTGVRSLIEEGRLVDVLPQFQAEPMPVSLLYANRRHLPKRVQVFMAWITEIMQPYVVQ
ncbi:MAG: LysR family transcriptional regulator [Burkholderiaceae bacterium]